MTTARLAARAARLEAAVNDAVTQVTAALPAIGAEEATAALEAAVPITVKGPARFLEELAAHMCAHPGALTSGSSLCPPVLLRLTHVLHEAGHQVIRPGCAHCGKITADLRQLREEGRICSSCDSRSRKNGTCGRCGATGVLIVARRPEGGICHRCYRRDPEIVEECAECGRLRNPVVRLPGGGTLCHACWKRPQHTCVSCGKTAPAALLAEEGAYCHPGCFRNPHRRDGTGIMEDVLTTDYDGCGRCLVATRRLSRKSDATSSPQRQADQDLQAAADAGGHVIAWADDWEVSGATDPLTRPGLGPWLRGEMGPYDGIVTASVDRVGRNVRDTLNTQALLTEQGRIIVTADHTRVWDFTDPNQENEWLAKAWGSQMELRAIQKRNRDETIRARNAGEPKQRPSYGYMYVRLAPTAKVDHVALDPVGAQIIREVARRILADQTGKITIGTEAVRLTREGIPSPGDRRAQLYGRPVKGGPWTGHTLKHILCSEAALGYLMHGGRPVLGADGRPVRLAEPLWDRATHDALVQATAPKRDGKRAPKGMRLLTGAAFCGNCGARLHVTGRGNARYAYECTARIRGIRASAKCKPAPAMALSAADALVSEWFLARYGSVEVMRKIYDPGTGHAAQIAELEATRTRLREDRQAGLYDDAEDAEWFRTEYRRLGEEITALKALPERKPGMRLVPTGRTIAREWDAADNARRREMLAEFEVRVVLHPAGHDPRVAVTGMEISPDGSA